MTKKQYFWGHLSEGAVTKIPIDESMDFLFSALWVQGLIVLSDTSAVHLIYTRIQGSELHHLHVVAATFNDLWISLDRRHYMLPNQQGHLKNSLIPMCVTWSLPLPGAENSLVLLKGASRGNSESLAPGTAMFLDSLHPPLACINCGSLNPTCPHAPAVLSATRQATCP